jgi:putative membrane protein
MVCRPPFAYAGGAMKTRKKFRILPLCAGALLGLTAFAQNAPTQVPGDRDGGHSRNAGSNTSADQTTIHGRADMKVSRADHRFFKKAAYLGEKEVALSRIAADRATNPEVRAFASEMVRAHTAANTELAALMKRRGVVLDDRDQANERRELAKAWNEKKAGDFDEAYLEKIIECHQDAIDVLENGVESKDTDIAAYAAQLLPSVKAHLAQAEKLEELVD